MKPNSDQILALRSALHRCPELSGQEHETMALLEQFLRENTSLQVENRSFWLLATHFEGENLPTVAFRADMDVIPDGKGGARHGCGHDGHSAILCALALLLDGKALGRNVHFIFQPAEETGEGARNICASWPYLKTIERIYGLHNIPGYAKGTLLLRDECFACASVGLMVKVTGRPAHAAYPGDGANPTALLSRLVLETPQMIADILRGDSRLLMHTVVGLNAGGENFGLSASEGTLCMTLRGYRQEDIDELIRRIRSLTEAVCAEEEMQCSFERCDAFPDTTNTPALVARARAVWQDMGLTTQTLAEPMRWSEDFGHYLKEIPGMFFGLATGEAAPGLHTENYEFDDTLIAPAVQAFAALI